MICLRSQLTLNISATATLIWSKLCEWRIQSRNTPLELKKWFSECSFEKLPFQPVEKVFGKIKVSVYKSSENSFAFNLQEKTVITSICFNSELSDINFSLEIERTDNEQAKIGRPKIFEFLEPYLDNKKYSKVALKEGDFSVVSKFINGQADNYSLPAIYVSKNKKEEYLVNPDELAKKLFGIALVYKEPSTSFAKLLREKTDGRAPYNGAIGIFYKNSRIIVMPENATDFDYFYRLSKISVRIPQIVDLTWFGMVTPYFKRSTAEITSKTTELTKQITRFTTITVLADFIQKIAIATSETEKKNLQFELAELKKNLSSNEELVEKLKEELIAERKEKENLSQELEKQKREKDDFINSFDSEIAEKQKRIDELEKENAKLLSYKDAFSKTDSKDINISIKCSEKSLYPNEIESFIKGILFEISRKFETYISGKRNDRNGCLRIYDVLKSIYENNPEFNFENSETFELIKKFENAKTCNDDEYKKLLDECGFKYDRHGSHSEFFFYGDERYPATAPGSSSDKSRSIKNNFSKAKKCILNVNDIKNI